MTQGDSQDVFSHKSLTDQQAVTFPAQIMDLPPQDCNNIVVPKITYVTKYKEEAQETSSQASFIDIGEMTLGGLHGLSLPYGYKSIFIDEAEKKLRHVAHLDVRALDIFNNKAAKDPLVFIGTDKKQSKQLCSGTAVMDAFKKGILYISNKSEAKYNKQFYLLSETPRKSFSFPYKMPSNGDKLHLTSKINTSEESKFQCVLKLTEEEIDMVEQLVHEGKLSAEQIDTSSSSDYYNQHRLRRDTFSKVLQFQKCVESLHSLATNSQVEEGVKTQSISLENSALFIGCTSSGFFVWLMSGILNKAIRDYYRYLQGLICSLKSQDGAQQRIVEKAGERNTNPKTYPDLSNHSISFDGFVESPTARERGTAMEQDRFFNLQNVKALKKPTFKHFPQMITMTELRGNDIPRPYGAQTFSNNRISAPMAQQEASQKQLWTAQVTLSSAETREDNSNPYEITSTPSPREESVSASPVDTMNSDLGLCVTPPNSLISDRAEHLEMPAENEEVRPAMNVEQTKPPATLCTSANNKENESHSKLNIDSTDRKTDCLPQNTKFDDCDLNDVLWEEGTEDLKSSVHNTETETEQSANTFVCPDSLAFDDVEQVWDSAPDSLHFSAPVQAQSPENYGLLYESWSQPKSLNKLGNQSEPEGISSFHHTLSARSHKNPADDTVCETSSAMASEEGECKREDPCLVPAQESLKPFHSVLSTNGMSDDDQDEVQYRRMGQERSIIAHPMEEESQPRIFPSTADRPFLLQPVNYTTYSTLSHGQFTPSFGASRHAFLAIPGGIPDQGLQPPLIVHATGSRPPMTFTDPDFLDISQARNPEYSDLRARRATYNRTWDLINSVEDPTSMALAGFFRPDPERPQCVRCFYCGLELDFNGQSGWEEHLRHSPSCRYLRVMGGEQFVKELQIRRTRK